MYYPHTIFSALLLQLFFHILRRVAGNSRNAGSALSSWHFLYYCLCYKIYCWELTNTGCHECFIQYLDLPGCLKSYWNIRIKGLLPSLQHQEIKAFNFSQNIWDFYFIWTDLCFCVLVSERKQCSRPSGFITPRNHWACTRQPYAVSGTEVCCGAGAKHSSHSLNPSLASVSLWKV